VPELADPGRTRPSEAPVTTTFAYDEVEYPSAALPQAHPGHVHAVARMFGRDPVPADRCRYLEVGCGDGTHLIACAFALPESTFVGVDLSAVAVERGRRLAGQLGLSNVSLYAADLTAWEPPPGGFDYVVSHGCYSWVPAPVRDGLLRLLARSLRPEGVGYVSYNAYPGCYLRRMVWEMLRFHADDAPDPADKISRAREMLTVLAAGQVGQAGRPNTPSAVTGPELDRLLHHSKPQLMYHDDLSGVNDPVYLHQFVAHARQHGLHFLAEAQAHAMAVIGFPPAVTNVLNELARKDVIQKEQYLDFLRLRRFRETLLTLDPAPPRAEPDPARITTLAVASPARPPAEPIDLAPGVEVAFAIEKGATASTDEPIGKAALTVLGERWPARVPFAELLRTAAARLGRDPTPADTATLAGLLTEVWTAGMVRLNDHCPRFEQTASERPVASPLARLLARRDGLATSLLHATTELDSPPTRLLVQLLDGTRDRDRLAADLVAAYPEDARPDPESLRADLDRDLDHLARTGLLVG
jgi:SAM-dependent methyltransferase/methyltransferase-like protein